MEKLIILDFKPQEIKVHIYNVDPNIEIDWNYIESLGFDSDECIWYFGTKIDVFKHKGILK